MNREMSSYLTRSTGLATRVSLVFLILGLVASLTLIKVLRPAVSQPKEPRQLLVQADHFAWLSNWQRAGELYARAEQIAIQRVTSETSSMRHVGCAGPT